MFVVIDKARLLRLFEVTRDDGRPEHRGKDEPFYRIAAADHSLRLSGQRAEATVSATVHEEGVVFLHLSLFWQMLHLLPEEGFVAIQANSAGIMFGDTRLSPESVEMLLYADPATAPALHPLERGDMPEQIRPPRPPPDPTLFEL